MAIQERLYDIGEVWDLYCQPDNELKRFELIDGVLFEMSGPGDTLTGEDILPGFSLPLDRLFT